MLGNLTRIANYNTEASIWPFRAVDEELSVVAGRLFAVGLVFGRGLQSRRSNCFTSVAVSNVRTPGDVFGRVCGQSKDHLHDCGCWSRMQLFVEKTESEARRRWSAGGRRASVCIANCPSLDRSCAGAENLLKSSIFSPQSPHPLLRFRTGYDVDLPPGYRKTTHIHRRRR